MLKTTIAAVIVSLTTMSALPQAEARSLTPVAPAAQAEKLVVPVGHRVDRRDYRRHARPHHRRLGRGQIVRRLAWRGYYGFSRVRDRGPVYAVTAFSPRGHRVSLRVDARTGDIVRRRQAGRHMGPGRNHRGRDGRGPRFSR
ncbi:hypothetical protein [Breoghania sp. L-A4]|uniref:hypothetical protein n=1 Tax=Breoghania sp. L-A4 TaxID=2304600 RepID=UPI000E359F3E|nr:hypothetical protein [Breoghania sp. L-A4]AXS41864.1 hypothetical protein D1F64_19940 [Breoghania sp. L-A4]